MCCFCKIIYACGHRDVIRAPCEWRDEGVPDKQGRRHPCEKSSKNSSDLTRLCSSCSPSPSLRTGSTNQNPAGQDRIGLDSTTTRDNVKETLPSKEISAISITIRNEAYLRKRAKRAVFIPGPLKYFIFPSPQELHVQFCVNEEFLTRRIRRRLFQRYQYAHNIYYQDYLDAAHAHAEAVAVLKDSALTLHDAPVHPVSVWKSDVATQTLEISGVDQSTQTDIHEEATADSLTFEQQTQTNIHEEAVVDSSLIVLPIRDMVSQPIPLRSRRPLWGLGRLESVEPQLVLEQEAVEERPLQQGSEGARWDTGYQRLLDFLDPIPEDPAAEGPIADDSIAAYPIDEDPIPEDEVPGEEAGFEEIPLGLEENPDQQQSRNDQISEWANFASDALSINEWNRGYSPEPEQDKVPLDSPEGIAQLANIRAFLCMCPDASPTEVFSFAHRNQQLMDNVMNGRIPVRRFKRIRGRKFQIDLGLNEVQEASDEKWELRYGFIQAWNSLNWEMINETRPRTPFPILPEHYGNESDGENWNGRDNDDAENNNIENGDEGDNVQDEEDAFSPIKEVYTTVKLQVAFGRKFMKLRCQTRRASNLRRRWTYVKICADDPEGRAILSRLQQLLAIPPSRAPQEISLFIDRNHDLLTYIPGRRIPRSKLLARTDKNAKRRAQFNARNKVRAKRGKVALLTRKGLIDALKNLDWKESNAQPLYFMLSPLKSSTDNARQEEDGDRASSCLRRTSVSLSSGEFELMELKRFKEFRCYEPSPLRTGWTRPNLENAADSEDAAQGEDSDADDDNETIYSQCAADPPAAGDVLSEPFVSGSGASVGTSLTAEPAASTPDVNLNCASFNWADDVEDFEAAAKAAAESEEVE